MTRSRTTKQRKAAKHRRRDAEIAASGDERSDIAHGRQGGRIVTDGAVSPCGGRACCWPGSVADAIGYTVVPAGTVELLLDVVRAYEARVEESDLFLRIANDEANRLRTGLAELERHARTAAMKRSTQLLHIELDNIADHASALLKGEA